uniref:BHLH domain-containing protein n=1 Tax=Macrostomum lignano TaxID=282301 RepID=A0A1I8IVJ5_9PLAT
IAETDAALTRPQLPAIKAGNKTGPVGGSNAHTGPKGFTASPPAGTAGFYSSARRFCWSGRSDLQSQTYCAARWNTRRLQLLTWVPQRRIESRQDSNRPSPEAAEAKVVKQLPINLLYSPAVYGSTLRKTEAAMALDRKKPQQQQPARVTVAYTNEPCRRKLQFVNGKFAAQKPQTSTVQRRNERERNRIRLINRTFAALRASLPPASASAAAAAAAAAATASPAPSGGGSAKERRRLSKVQVLRTAAAYIAELAALLRADDAAAAAAATAPAEVATVSANCSPAELTAADCCYGNAWQQPQQPPQHGDCLPDLRLLLEDDSRMDNSATAAAVEDFVDDEFEDDGGRFRLAAGVLRSSASVDGLHTLICRSPQRLVHVAGPPNSKCPVPTPKFQSAGRATPMQPSAGRRCKLPTTTTASARKCRPSSDLLSASALATTAAPDGKHLANNDGSGRMLRSADESQLLGCSAVDPAADSSYRSAEHGRPLAAGAAGRAGTGCVAMTDRQKIFAHCFLRVSVGDFGGPEHALNSLGRLKQLRSRIRVSISKLAAPSAAARPSAHFSSAEAVAAAPPDDFERRRKSVSLAASK